MASVLFLLPFVCAIACAVAAQRVHTYEATLEWLGGLMLVSGFVGLGLALARAME